MFQIPVCLEMTFLFKKRSLHYLSFFIPIRSHQILEQVETTTQKTKTNINKQQQQQQQTNVSSYSRAFLEKKNAPKIQVKVF